MRFRMTFNPDNAEHMTAYEILSRQHKNKKTDYIAKCIVAYERIEVFQNAVSQAAQTAFVGVTIGTSVQPPTEVIEKTKSREDIPADMLNVDW